jgi:hypothetical protein
MDRRAKKLEKKRKNRDEAKRKAATLVARQPSDIARLARSAVHEPFGPCFVSRTWDDIDSPALVSVVMTRGQPGRRVVMVIALVDRTCLGVKDAFVREMPSSRDVPDFVDQVGVPHGGMLQVEPLIAQSVVFHAIDHARSLGFEPHRDFPAAFFGPRPAELATTPWHKPERPIYISGPHDNVFAITRRLTAAVGPEGYQRISERDFDDDDDVFDEGPSQSENEPLIHSPLECTVERDGITLRILIYRSPSDSQWCLEVEDHLGGSTVFDGNYLTDQEALDAVMAAIPEEGIETFVAGAVPYVS